MDTLFKNIFDTNELNNWQQLVSDYLPVLFIILIALIIIHFIMNIIKKLLTKTKIPKSSHPFVFTFIKMVFYFILVMAVCSHFGIDITTFVAAFSVIGVAISLSIQNTLANVMAGIGLLFTKHFDIDDYIEAGGVAGTVLRIGLSACKLRTYDGKIIYVPNSSIDAEKVINYTASSKRRVDITIGTSYNEKVENVKYALQEVIDETPEILRQEPIFVGITNFGESSIDYTVRVWVNNRDYWNAYLPMLERIKLSFERNHIEIPYNQLDVHIDNISNNAQ